MNSIPRILAAAAAIAAMTGAARADVTFRLKTVDRAGSENINTLLVRDGHFRMGIIDRNNRDIDGEFLYRPGEGPRGTLYALDAGRVLMRFSPGDPSSPMMMGPGGPPPGAGAGSGDMPGLTAEQRRAVNEARARIRGPAATSRAPRAERARGPIAITRTPRTLLLTLLEREAPLRAFGYDVRQGGVLRWRVWTAAPASLPNGVQVRDALRGFARFLAHPGLPAPLRDGLFIFDGNAFDGRIPVGFDEYNAAGELIEESRLEVVHCQNLEPGWFERGDAFWTYDRREEVPPGSCTPEGDGPA